MTWTAVGALVCVAAVGAWLLAGSGLASSAPPAPTELNLLLITCDTTRADFIGCYGDAAARTPSIDALAARGTRFARCTACTPLTLPSHTTILTGVYPFVHGVRQNAVDRLSPAFETLAETLKGAGVSTHAIVAAFVLQGRFGLNQGFDSYSDRMRPRDDNPAAAERRGDEVCEEALARLRENAGRRFFLWAHFYDPHFPYESPRGAAASPREAYADEIAFMDAQIGRLMDELRRLRIAEKTLVVLVGDHGEGLGDHGESEHGYFVHDTDMHVPLIVHCPGVVAAGRVVDADVRTIDVAPTVLDYLGLPPGAGLQGTSLRPPIEGGTRDLGLAAYGESMLAHELFGLSRLRLVQQDGWKYVHSSRPGLFNLRQDPREQNNRAEADPQRAERMREQLRELLRNAPPPPVDNADAPPLSDEDLQRLASLGYAGGLAPSTQPGASTLEPFEPGGEDPAAHVEAIESYVRAHHLTAQREFGAAETQLRDVVRKLPQAAEPLHELHLALRRLNRQDEMPGVCRELLAARPEATAARVLLGELLLRDGREEEAFAEFERALKHDPGSVAGHQNLAAIYRRRGDLDAARTHLEAAVERAPRDVGALRGLAQVCMQQERYAEAAALLRRALAINPNAAAMQRELDEALKRLGP